MDLPCVDCVCVAICKNKDYKSAAEDCQFLERFLHQGRGRFDKRYWRRKYAARQYLKPTGSPGRGWSMKWW